MSYTVRYTDDAVTTISKYKKSNPIAHKKVVKLVKEITEHPRVGTGHPKPLVNGYVIGPEGEIYRCWEDVGNRELEMGIIQNGNVKLNNIHKLARFIVGIDPTMEKSKESIFIEKT